MKSKLLIAAIGIVILVSGGSPYFASEADSEIGIFFTERDSLPKESNIVGQPEKDRVGHYNRVLPKTGDSKGTVWSLLGSFVLYGLFFTRKRALKLKRSLE